MDKETAFALARQMIDGLPCRREVIDFWDMPRIEANTDRVKWTDAANQLAALAREAPADVAVYFQIWASDAAVGAGDLENGLALLPLPDLGGRASNSLDLKLSLAIPPSARDITALFGPRVTKFGKENLSAVERYIQIQLDERATHGVSPSIGIDGAWGLSDTEPHKVVSSERDQLPAHRSISADQSYICAHMSWRFHEAALAARASAWRGDDVASTDGATLNRMACEAGQEERDLYTALHRFVLSRLRDRCDSDDLVQETFVRLYTYREGRAVEDVGAFSFTIARNLIRDRFRRLRAAPVTAEMPEGLVCPQPRADEMLIHRERVAALATAIRAMPPLRREVFLRRRLDGDAIATISYDLDLTAAAIEKHVSRAVADLRRALDRRGLWIGDPS